MDKKIIFLTTAHTCFDDRIYYHQAISLAEKGYAVKIVSFCSDFNGMQNGVEFESYNIITSHSRNEKIEKFVSILSAYKPQVIICSEPLPVFAAKKFKKNSAKTTIVYDITEWYPSKKQLRTVTFPKKIAVFFSLLFINLLAGKKADAFIFGEDSKKFPFNLLFPKKPHIVLPYFPDEKYISYTKKEYNPHSITLCYTGRISKEDGIENFFTAIQLFIQRNPKIKVKILIIGAPKKQDDKAYFESLLQKFAFPNITIEPPKEYTEFTKSIAEADICFDLREINFEYNHCLPIKIFYYGACGKPVIYSDLKAIRKQISIDEFGFLVNPKDSIAIAEKIEFLVYHPIEYSKFSVQARNLFENTYNWQKISSSLFTFIEQIQQ